MIIGRRLLGIGGMMKRTEPLGLYLASRRQACQGNPGSSEPSAVAEADELCELADAVLCADGPVRDLAGLPLFPKI